MPAGCEGDMNAIQVLSLALLSGLAARAQIIKLGRCPRPAVQQKFDAATQIPDGTALNHQLQPEEPRSCWSPQQRAPVRPP